MENKFKAGDVVVARDSYPGQFTAGNEYTVKGMHGDTISVELDDRGSTTNGWHEKNFKLAETSKFTVGDRVDIVSNSCGRVSYVGKSGTIVKKHDTDAKAWRVAIEGDAMGVDYPFWEDEIAIATPATPTPTTSIVCLIENGRPLSATRSYVHVSAEAADKEARRLASVHKGKEFGVFTLCSAHKEAKVYEHEWQRLAADGRKIEAIKVLKSLTGMGLKPAKDAVEYFLDAA